MQRLSEIDRDRAWLATQLGKDLSTIHRWVGGSRTLSASDLRLIALALHRPVEWFTEPKESAAA